MQPGFSIKETQTYSWNRKQWYQTAGMSLRSPVASAHRTWLHCLVGRKIPWLRSGKNNTIKTKKQKKSRRVWSGCVKEVLFRLSVHGDPMPRADARPAIYIAPALTRKRLPAGSGAERQNTGDHLGFMCNFSLQEPQDSTQNTTAYGFRSLKLYAGVHTRISNMKPGHYGNDGC